MVSKLRRRIDHTNIGDRIKVIQDETGIDLTNKLVSFSQEYLKYIKYMQSKLLFGKVENLELEDLQGVSGLKALRVEVLYKEDYLEKSSLTVDKLLDEIRIDT